MLQVASKSMRSKIDQAGAQIHSAVQVDALECSARRRHNESLFLQVAQGSWRCLMMTSSGAIGACTCQDAPQLVITIVVDSAGME